MQAVQASPEDAHPKVSPPRQNPKGSGLASIAISSFAAFRSQSSQPVPIAVQSPVRRKPLPADSPVVARFSAQQSKNADDTVAIYNDLTPDFDEDLFLPRDLDDNPHGRTPLTANTPKIPRALVVTKKTPPTISTAPRHDRASISVHTHQPTKAEALKAFGITGAHARSPTMPNMPLYSSAIQQAPDLKLNLDRVTEDFMDDYSYAEDDSRPKKNDKPKSPGAGFTSFFGWNSRPQNGAESPATAFSGQSLSPDSPRNNKMNAKTKPNGLDIPAANSSYFNVPGTPLLSSSPQMNAHVEELERELRESAAGQAENRRTSDYYSDSGTSSIRFPITDPEGKLEELEMQRRKAEQERASLKVRMAERLQEELRRRRDLEEQVQQLEDKVHDKSSAGSFVETPKLKELSLSLEDAKRRLAEERQVKENFEDLLTALREELEKHRNEADNLRDEVVPQLRARLEVLESDAADTEKLVYETTRMQQEIQQLRSENESLVNARRSIPQQPVQFQSIAEEAEKANNTPLASMRVGLTRSNSLARSSAGLGSKRGSLSRSNSVKDRSGDISPVGAPTVSNPMKELEEQRDALHKALKYLLQRQELQQKEFKRRIKEVEAERDAALSLTPRRTAFHKEVTGLRREVDSLRRRADEALEQKWQCEKGLSGLRMDLDRAQQETGSLRDLLQEHDISIPEIRLENQPLALDRAYNELRTTHALSLARVKQMESGSDDSLGAASAEATRTLELLKQSISDAEAERDYAMNEAEQYRKQARALRESEMEHLGKEKRLSGDLFDAATRMDDLSQKIQQQLTANSALRSRLAEAITRGELEQQKSTEQIIQLEQKLKAAEDKVMLAQQSSEDAVARHEDEAQAIKESHTNHLRRNKSGLLSPAAFSPKMPPSPVFAQKSPRLGVTSSGPAMTLAEATKTEMLEKRVEELEKALRDADHEMEEVVSRMNTAQMEVAELQMERDEAMRSTRKLQAEIVAEREKVKALMS
ncbi:CCDC158 multi-domain protein [Pyrenophora tritici-repentis]|nr:CCDC158 multi-domain protein [Pyrenophora tritici-repentis]KAI0613578.1 CCDC158 multi-domain protein [Pyrenophora tritici-repentis]PZC95855.1 Smc, Chromosome segregation ATPase [Pyrenophora tritici-repentis]